MQLKSLIIIGMIAIAATLSGCLMVEVVDYRITISPDGHHATSESVYHNIYDNDSTEQFDIDFNELIESWKGNEYVDERKQEGVRITERSLKLVGGKLMGVQKSEFSDTSQSFKNLFAKDSLRLGFKTKDIQQIVRTNGKVRKSKDSTIIVWPKTIKDYRITVKVKPDSVHMSFVPRFQAYLKKESGK